MEEAGVTTLNRVVREGFFERVTFELLASPGNLSSPETELPHCWQIPYRLSQSPSVRSEAANPNLKAEASSQRGQQAAPGGRGLLV